MAEVARLLDQRGLVTVTGAPGMGKSALAGQVVARLRPPPTVAVVELGSLSEAARVAPAVAAAAGVEDLSPQALGAAVGGGARWLVVLLDDCDHVREAAAAAAQALRAAGARVLATSQRALGLEGEARWRVAPLWLAPADAHASADVIERSEAVRLFSRCAAEVQPGFALTPQSAPTVGAICRRLDGVPLAIEAAARQVEFFSPAEILARLERDPVAYLAASPHSATARRSLWARMQTSYGRLPARERVLWARLSIFAAGFGLQAAQAVCAGDDLGDEQVLEALSALVAASLVEADTTRSLSRYRLLEPLRHYARQRLEDADEQAAVATAHARWCLNLVKGAGDPGQGQRWIERLAVEHANIEAAWRWATSAADPEQAVTLGRAHAFLCRASGRHDEARAAFEEASSLVAPARAAPALCYAGGAAATAGATAIAAARLDRGVALARSAGDVAGEVWGEALGGMLATLRGEHTSGLGRVERAVELAHTADDESCLVAALGAAGHAHLLVGQPTEARDYFARALALARRRGDDSATADALVGAGRGALIQGDYPEAQASLTEGLALAMEAREVHTHGVALAVLGELARVGGKRAVAGQRFGECAGLAREAATPFPLALALLGLGRLAGADDAQAARASLEQALAVARESTLAHIVPRCLVDLGRLAARDDDADGAEQLLVEALQSARQSGDKIGEAHALSELGQTATARGDHQRAGSLHHQALALHANIGDPAGIADSLHALAGTAARHDRFTEAARLLGAAHSIRDTHGYIPATDRQREHELHLRMARDGLNQEAFQTAWAQGAALSTEEAIAYATRGRGRRGRPTKGWDALTPAEHRVVALAQQGLTNAQIAQRLLISRRTVDAHLAHVYAKLGIHSRMQLTTAPPKRDDAASKDR